MFDHDPAKLDALNTQIRALVKETFDDSNTGDFALPAVIARLMRDSYCIKGNTREWESDYYYAKFIGSMIPFLTELHKGLVNNGNDHTDPYDRGGNDNEVCYLHTADLNDMLLAFRHQNYSYMVLLRPSAITDYKIVDGKLIHMEDIPVYSVYIRITTGGKRSIDYAANEFKTISDAGKGIKDGKGSYFSELTSYDRGFVLNVLPHYRASEFTGLPFYTTEHASRMNPVGPSIMWDLQACASMFQEIFKDIGWTTTMSKEIYEGNGWEYVDNDE